LSGQSFAEVVKRLSSKYRFIIPDMRGFGKSGIGPSPSTMETLAQDALAILDELGIARAVVGGVSMGGYAAMALLREDASRAQALVLVDTHPNPDDDAGRAKREENAQIVLKSGMEALAEIMVPKLLGPNASPALRQEVRSLILSNPPEGAAAALRGMALRPSRKELLARFAGPALVVVGEHDPLVSSQVAKDMAGLLANGRLLQIPGAGHLAHQEAPDVFCSALDTFLSELSAPESPPVGA
jgi:pimeloyl-ACP methyl ester carboxylesterase